MTTNCTKNIKYLVLITTHTESILDILCKTRSIHTAHVYMTQKYSSC